MEKIDINKIRGKWQEWGDNGMGAGGDDTIESIQMVAEKVNELIDILSPCHQAKETWQDRFRDEFGIHFKDSKGELEFAIGFIEELLENQSIS